MQAQLPQPPILRQQLQHLHQNVIEHKPPLVRSRHARVETGRRILQPQRHLANESRIDGPNDAEEFTDGFEAYLVPFPFPVGAVTPRFAHEEEVVLGVQDAAAFVVDLLAGAQEGGGAGEV